MIETGSSDDFYDWIDWKKIRASVLKFDNFECQICKERGRQKPAVIVHHVKHLRDRPDLALSVFDPDSGARQLISLCRACHEEQHPERGLKKYQKSENPLTFERWD